MKLRQLLKDIKAIKIEGDTDIDISDIAYDSRKVKKGGVFAAIPGTIVDGTRFVPMAIEKGAAAIVCEKDTDIKGRAVKIVVRSARAALADMSAEYFGHPSRDLVLAGITGTNGKTTTSHLLDSIFKAAGKKTGLIGTIETRIGDETVPSALTTPESYELQKYLSRMVKEGVTHAVMEVSSHSISMKRIKGTEFDCAVYTNLSHEHLDFHKTLEAYLDTKLNLFRMLGSGTKKNVFGAINIDDEYSGPVIEETNGEIVTYSMDKDAAVKASVRASGLDGMTVEVDTGAFGQGTIVIRTGLPGKFNAYNILAASACALKLGIPAETIKRGIEGCAGVPGRFELIVEGQDYHVVVDFAHTPDGLEKLLASVNAGRKGRTILVFGCTGDRDRAKRPVMGAIASGNSDIMIITSDDPHNEDPERIINEVEAGIDHGKRRPGSDCFKITDRAEAIRKAVSMASKDDIVVIAGRGHEQFQEIKGKNIEIDDRAVARKAIKSRN